MALPGKRCGLVAQALLAIAVGGGYAPADAGAESIEYLVKASLLLNFAKFADWPAGSAQAVSSSVAICVLGTDSFGGALDEVVAGRSAGGRPIEVRRHRQLEGIESCHVLFVASSERERLAQILARIGDAPVLTVGESGDFDERGGVIRLLVEGNRARFCVNLAPMRVSHLQLSSKLLRVARTVRVVAP
ncbi:MAG: YfiR family protein [Vicinamibacteria bacterium]